MNGIENILVSEDANEAIEERKYLLAEYSATRSIRTRGHILSGALKNGVCQNVSGLANFFNVSRTDISRELAAFDIPQSVWALYHDQRLVSSSHTRRLQLLQKEFGWARIESAVKELQGNVPSNRPADRYAALVSKLYSSVTTTAFGNTSFQTCVVCDIDRENLMVTLTFDEPAEAEILMQRIGSRNVKFR